MTDILCQLERIKIFQSHHLHQGYTTNMYEMLDQ